MTEAKKTERRKVLAKWLKETILRLGPTFIKIGQQFSTRVDILAQEYVDQLSELQVGDVLLKLPYVWPSITHIHHNLIPFQYPLSLKIEA